MEEKLPSETNNQLPQAPQTGQSTIGTSVSSPSVAPPDVQTPTPQLGGTGIPNAAFSSAGISNPSTQQPNASAVPPGISTPGGVGIPPKNHSHIGVIVAIVLLVVAVLGGAFGLAMMQNKPQSNIAPKLPVTQPTIIEPTPTSIPTPAEEEVTNTTGNGNERLQKDTEVLEATITGVAEDTQAVDEGLNDQQTNLSQ